MNASFDITQRAITLTLARCVVATEQTSSCSKAVGSMLLPLACPTAYAELVTPLFEAARRVRKNYVEVDSHYFQLAGGNTFALSRAD